jgi:hypothetical protein
MSRHQLLAAISGPPCPCTEDGQYWRNLCRTGVHCGTSGALSMSHVKVINPASQCDRMDIHHDTRAWFGVWATGVTPPRPGAVSTPSRTAFTTSTFAANPFSVVTPRKPRERCAKTNCNGFTAKGCPYRLCVTHCRLAGGCSKHKLTTTIRLEQPSSDTSRPSQSNPLA